MEVRECTKGALLIGGASIEFIEQLLNFVPQNNNYICHSCSIILLSRATTEMIEAHKSQNWQIIEIKLYSILMIIVEGFLKVFKENLFLLPNGEIGCSESDYERFGKCCKKINS